MSLPSSYLSPLLHTSSILLSSFSPQHYIFTPHPPQSPCMLSHLSFIPLFTLPLSTIIFSLFPPPPLWRHPSSGSSSKARIYILIYQFPAAVEAVMDGVLPAPQRCHELPWWLPTETATHWPLHHSDWWGRRREKREKKKRGAEKQKEKWEKHNWRRAQGKAAVACCGRNREQNHQKDKYWCARSHKNKPWKMLGLCTVMWKLESGPTDIVSFLWVQYRAMPVRPCICVYVINPEEQSSSVVMCWMVSSVLLVLSAYLSFFSCSVLMSSQKPLPTVLQMARRERAKKWHGLV